MQRTAILVSQPARTHASPGWADVLGRAWEDLALSDDDRFLREGCDPVDVEWRLKRLERGRADRFGPLDPSA